MGASPSQTQPPGAAEAAAGRAEQRVRRAPLPRATRLALVAIAFVGLALVILLFTRGRLGYHAAQPIPASQPAYSAP